jgi:Zn-finger nucleic acid-binding protein
VEHAGKKCPRCEEGLLDVRVRAKLLCECPKCGGLWVDNDTLRQICADKEQQQAVMGFDAGAPRIEGGARTQAGRIYIPCPECGKLMNRQQFAGCSGVIVDWCKAHGTWFDRDELKQIIQFILAGGLIKSREREKAMLAQEKLNLKEARRNLLTISSFAALQPDHETEFLGVLGGLCRILRD